MNQKEIPAPTPDELAQELGRIEQATLEEEVERKRRGLTLEPGAKRKENKDAYNIEPAHETKPGDVIPPGRQVHAPNLEGVSPMATGRAGEQLGLKEKTIWHDISEWLVQNPQRKPSHLDPSVDIRTEGEAESLPTNFLDFLIGEALQSNINEDMRHFLWSILENLRTIIIRTTSGKITLSLRDSQRNLVHLYFNTKPPFEFYKIE